MNLGLFGPRMTSVSNTEVVMVGPRIPVVVMQRTGERNLNRYKPLKTSIINQSEHAVKMRNGAVLRKSGVALKRTAIHKKRAPCKLAAPPTPWDLTRKLLANQPSRSKGTTGTYQRAVGKRSKFQIRDNAEDSESNEEDYLPLATTRQAVETTNEGNPGADVEGERQGTSSGEQDQVPTETITIRPSDYETETEYTMARETKIEINRRKEDTTGNTPRETEREVEQNPETRGKKRGRKHRLVSYSSQESASSLDETSSRRSGRNHTAVTKIGAVMIDNIQKAEK